MSEQAKAVIVGPAQIQPGDLTVLDASQSKANAYHWLLLNSDKPFLAMSGGQKCVFSPTEPGRYLFAVSVALLDNGTLTMDGATHELVVGNPQPEPQPVPPQPDPTPPPSPADPIAKAVFDAAMNLSPEVRSKAKVIAEGYRAVAAEGAGRGDLTPQEMAQKVELYMRANLPEATRLAWNSVGQVIDDIADPHVTDRESAVSVFNKIAEGLEAVR